jgi:hypothetical protein
MKLLRIATIGFALLIPALAIASKASEPACCALGGACCQHGCPFCHH